ncbi:hypothetical protein D9M70_597130 [compost metagenome]
MLKLAATLCPAPWAFSSTHICNGGTVAKPAAPTKAMNSTTATRFSRANVISPSTRASAAMLPSRAGTSLRSASLPPSRLPSISPPPNTSSTGDTALSEKPARRVSSGEI